MFVLKTALELHLRTGSVRLGVGKANSPEILRVILGLVVDFLGREGALHVQTTKVVTTFQLIL